jgi:hypothetical protein
VTALRGECLKRDRHRCVISGRFDDAEALERVEREGDDEAKDDDGNKLKREAGTFAPLEIAHILPHSLMNVGSGGEGSWYVHLYVGIHSALVLIESTVGFATILPQPVAM